MDARGVKSDKICCAVNQKKLIDVRTAKYETRDGPKWWHIIVSQKKKNTCEVFEERTKGRFE